MQEFKWNNNKGTIGISTNNTIVAIRLKPGQDPLATLEQFALENDIGAASIMSCVGSLTTAAIRFANNKDQTILEGYFEIVSLVGSFSKAGAHVHISVSDNKGTTIGGHLMCGSAVYTTAEITFVVHNGIEFKRAVQQFWLVRIVH